MEFLPKFVLYVANRKITDDYKTTHLYFWHEKVHVKTRHGPLEYDRIKIVLQYQDKKSEMITTEIDCTISQESPVNLIISKYAVNKKGLSQNTKTVTAHSFKE